jgi:hypothetical protein
VLLAPQDLMPLIYLANNASVGGEQGQFAAVTMRADCMIQG